MVWCKCLNVKIVEIRAPALTVLSSETDFRDGEGKYSIKVVGARLSKFITRLGLRDNFIFTGSKVDFAALDCATGYDHEHHSKLYRKFTLQVRGLLKELWSINYLKVASDTAEAIAQPYPGLCLPRYDKLERLDIQYNVGQHDSLLELLHSTPFLKILHVEMCSSGYRHRNHGHDVVRSMPSCIVSSLEEFKITIRLVNKCELSLVKFLMKNGKKLKKIYVLFCHDGPIARDFQNQLSSFTKASMHLQVVIDYKKYLDLDKLLADL